MTVVKLTKKKENTILSLGGEEHKLQTTKKGYLWKM